MCLIRIFDTQVLLSRITCHGVVVRLCAICNKSVTSVPGPNQVVLPSSGYVWCQNLSLTYLQQTSTSRVDKFMNKANEGLVDRVYSKGILRLTTLPSSDKKIQSKTPNLEVGNRVAVSTSLNWISCICHFKPRR